MKKIEVKVRVQGKQLLLQYQIAAGEGVDYAECGQHHPAYKTDTGSLMGNIVEPAKEIERLTSTDDDLFAHLIPPYLPGPVSLPRSRIASACPAFAGRGCSWIECYGIFCANLDTQLKESDV
jgi:hypothetical protein